MVDGHIWRKSSYSGGVHQDCVEVADSHLGSAVRDSKNPDHGYLAFGPGEWRVFLADVKSDRV